MTTSTIKLEKPGRADKRAAAMANLKLKPAKDSRGRMIDYTKESGARHRLVKTPDGHQYYAGPVLTRGNSKLDKSIYIFDLLSVVSCPNCRQCAKSCYARKSERQYRTTYNARALNSIQAATDLAGLEAAIVARISRARPEYVRIHSSGDFFNAAYAAMWSRVIKQFPATRFYTYTKSPYRPDPAPNFNIVESIGPDGLPNFGPIESVQARAAACGGVLCPYRTKAWAKEHGTEYRPVHCGHACSACMHEARVFFVQH